MWRKTCLCNFAPLCRTFTQQQWHKDRTPVQTLPALSGSKDNMLSAVVTKRVSYSFVIFGFSLLIIKRAMLKDLNAIANNQWRNIKPLVVLVYGTLSSSNVNWGTVVSVTIKLLHNYQQRQLSNRTTYSVMQVPLASVVKFDLTCLRRGFMQDLSRW